LFFLFFITSFILKNVGKWHTHITKEQIKMTFSFVKQ